MNDCPYLFVYGTLLEPFARPEYEYLNTYAQDLGDAHTQGKLYNIEWYPGLITSNNSKEKVLGRLWQANSMADFKTLIQYLDVYEGLTENQAKPWQYRKQQIGVVNRAKENVQAWCYVYNWPTEGLALIESGDFLAFAQRTGLVD